MATEDLGEGEPDELDSLDELWDPAGVMYCLIGDPLVPERVSSVDTTPGAAQRAAQRNVRARRYGVIVVYDADGAELRRITVKTLLAAIAQRESSCAGLH